MNFAEAFDFLAELVGKLNGVPGGPAKSAYPEKSAESLNYQESKVVDKNLEAKSKTATPGLAAKLDKEFWETF